MLLLAWGSAALLIVVDHLRRGFGHFNLGAHFLDLRRLLFELRRQRINPFFLFLHLAMLFEELVEQHRIHGFVTHGIDLPLIVASNNTLGFKWGNYARARGRRCRRRNVVPVGSRVGKISKKSLTSVVNKCENRRLY